MVLYFYYTHKYIKIIMNKTAMYCSIGTLIEWAEFTFYAYMSQKFALLFFPMFNANTAVLMSFATFAISYLARPLGGILFGHIGDKHGRNMAFSLSIFLMALVTLCMGILPTYQTIGLAAPILLVALRFLQGIAVSGEFTGAAIYLIENDTSKKPYLSSSWISTSSAAGMLIGSFASLIVSLPSMPIWTWRIPFCMGFLACLLGLYVRKKLPETKAYKNLLDSCKLEKIPLLTVLKNNKWQILQTMSLAAFVGIYIYICNIWWTTYVVTKHYFSISEAKLLTTIGQGCVVIVTPLMAMLAEKFGGKLIMRVGLIGATFFAPLLFLTSHTQIFYLVLLLQIIYALCDAMVTAPMFKFLSGLFPAATRCSGQAIGWSVSVAIFGGTAPLLSQYLLINNLGFLPAVYVSLSAIIALFMCHK